MSIQFTLPTYNQLTPQMRNLVNFPLNQNLLVVGAPGTWKSVVAIYRCKELAKQWKKVLLLCYNVLLNFALKEHSDKIICRTIDSFYGHITYTNNSNQNKKWPMISDEDIEVIKQEFENYVLINWKFDAVIIDEGQDLKPAILQWLSLITKHISIFADPNQPLKEECSDIGEIEYIFQWIHKEILDRNFRNTKEIYEFASQKFMLWNELANNPNLTARSVSDISSMPEIKEWVSTFEEQLKLITQYTSQHPNQTIGIFVDDQPQVDSFYTSLQWLWVDASMYHSKNKSNYSDKKNILVTTYTSAKWLEFDVVIVVIGKDTRKEKINQKLYVLSTRAKKKLYYLFA